MLQRISPTLLVELRDSNSVVVGVIALVYLGSNPGKTRSEGISLKGDISRQSDNTPPHCWMRDGLGLFIKLLPNVISLAEDKSCTRELELKNNLSGGRELEGFI